MNAIVSIAAGYILMKTFAQSDMLLRMGQQEEHWGQQLEHYLD